MAGTAKNYDIARIHQGPGDLWIIGGGVADSATPQLTIATDGTPDSTAHPTSIHLGSTDGAIQISAAPKFEDIRIDQADGPVARYVTELEMSLEAAMKDFDPTKIQQACPFATYATAGGYKQLTFGGLQTLAGLCIAVIVPKRAVAGKYIVAVLFSAHGTVGINAELGRSKAAVWKATFKGLSDITRTAGRQIGVVYETI